MPLLVLLLLLNVPGLAQDVSYQAFGKAQGMPSNTVYDLLQDQRGFIWLATDKGLFRYDGVHFRPYNNSQQNDKALSNLMEDAGGRVWCQNFTGQFFYWQADSLHLCEQLKPTGMYCPAAIVGGTTLMSLGSNAIRRFNITHFRTTDTPQPTGHLRPSSQVNGGYYYVMDAQANRIVGVSATGAKVSIAATPDKQTFYHAVVNETLFLIPKNDATLITARPANGRTYTIRLARKSLIQHVKAIDDQYLCLFTSAGFYLIDVRQKPRLVAPRLVDKNCTSLIRDREGNFWLSTTNDGLLLIPSLSVDVVSAGKPFSRLQAQPDERTLVYGTSDGEVGMIATNSLTSRILYKGATNAEVLSLFYDKPRSQLLFCSDQFYRLNNGQVQKVDIMSVKDMKAIDGQSIALAATGTSGRYRLDAHDPVVQIGNYGERVRAVAVLPGSPTIYTATPTGLWRHVPGQPGTLVNAQSLPLTDLTVTQTPTPMLFAASPTQGLFAFQNDRQILHLTKDNGLADNSLYRVKAYKNQVWWLTEKAVQCYDLTTKQIRTYDKTDGLPDADLKDLAFARDTAYIATRAGLVRFPVQLPATNPHRPQVLLTGLFQDHAAVPMTSPHTFRYDQNTIDIRYSVLSFRSQGAVQVYYRINRQAWLRADQTQRLLSLPSLAPDDYTVQIKAINEDGLVSAVSVVVRFTIERPFWLQYWFLIPLGLFSLLGTYLLYRNRLRRQQRETTLLTEKNRLEQELQQSRLTAIKSQMNPHFLFNALNTIQSYIYLNEKKQASSYLVKFSELTRLILDMSSDDTVALAQELKAIGLYLELEQMRFEDTLTYQLVVDTSLDPDQVHIPSMLIQPYVENAIKHGLMHKKTDRHLLVNFERGPGYLQVVIDDNGIGRIRSTEINQHRAGGGGRRHESFASAANQKRLALLNNGHNAQIGLEIIDKTDATGYSSGTQVVIRIPLL
ncbi:sensor histidine kinase [Fibrella aquatilis]|uniref:Histidine kinase n=1 Tax=Fibrella aquatilis TaxID=2817059 RepID=A0A939K2S8_9BACT|nr:histidine kinase [Fibrella aquatilis]MBO0934391.1 histidine kinase [Fibrella aquatilis]